MVRGFQQVKLGVKITSNALVNDVAKYIQENINRSHRELDLTIKRIDITNTSTKLEVSGIADLDKDKIKTINSKIENILDNLIKNNG
jgi:hypothetical protein